MCRGWDSNTQPSACGANYLTHWAAATVSLNFGLLLITPKSKNYVKFRKKIRELFLATTVLLFLKIHLSLDLCHEIGRGLPKVFICSPFLSNLFFFGTDKTDKRMEPTPKSFLLDGSFWHTFVVHWPARQDLERRRFRGLDNWSVCRTFSVPFLIT